MYASVRSGHTLPAVQQVRVCGGNVGGVCVGMLISCIFFPLKLAAEMQPADVMVSFKNPLIMHTHSSSTHVFFLNFFPHIVNTTISYESGIFLIYTHKLPACFLSLALSYTHTTTHTDHSDAKKPITQSAF